MQKTGTRYSQIVSYYLDLINRQLMCEGDKMPTEAEIGRLFNVSRITVRHAMEELAQSGYIVRMQGKGSFVRVKKTDMQLNHLRGFSEEMRMKGMEPSTVLRESSVIACGRVAAERLRIEPGTKIYLINRLRLADGTPMAVEQVHIPFFLCPGLTNHDLSGSLYRILSDQYRLRPHWASQDIEASIAGRSMADLLQMKAGSPALTIERISYLENDMPLEYVMSVYRGDRYSFHVDMRRNSEPARG